MKIKKKKKKKEVTRAKRKKVEFQRPEREVMGRKERNAGFNEPEEDAETKVKTRVRGQRLKQIKGRISPSSTVFICEHPSLIIDSPSGKTRKECVHISFLATSCWVHSAQ